MRMCIHKSECMRVYINACVCIVFKKISPIEKKRDLMVPLNYWPLLGADQAVETLGRSHLPVQLRQNVTVRPQSLFAQPLIFPSVPACRKAVSTVTPWSLQQGHTWSQRKGDEVAHDHGVGGAGEKARIMRSSGVGVLLMRSCVEERFNEDVEGRGTDQERR